MNGPISTLLEPLELKHIRDILGVAGPCITIILPAYRPGEPTPSSAALLKSYLQEASRQLTENGMPDDEREALLTPLAELERDPGILSGSHWGRAIFRAPDVFRQFELTEDPQPSLTVAGCFAVRGLLTELVIPRTFYILSLAKDAARLSRATYKGSEPVPFPGGLPETRQEALLFEPHERQLENRRAYGGSTAGAMSAVRFGTSSDRDIEYIRVADYYRMVDHALKDLPDFPGTPLILNGVEQETDAFKTISTYPDIVPQTLAGSPSTPMPEAEIVAGARRILAEAHQQKQAAALSEARERNAPSRCLTGTEEILKAAFESRVHELYLEDGADKSGIYEQGKYRSRGMEDLLNLAAVQTLIYGGSAFALPGGMIGGDESAIAILRY